MHKFRNYSITAVILLVIGFLYYYFTLPAINLHSKGLWVFLIFLLLIGTAVTAFVGGHKKNTGLEESLKPYLKSKAFKFAGVITLAVIVVFLIGTLLSSPIVNAKKYRQLIQISERNFTEDIAEISYNEIPILDKDSASLLGSRKMGSMVEFVSQFEVSDDYTQINFQNKPVRVTPLKYGSFFKWITNRKKGIPAYMKIDMTTQNVECVKLKDGIKYSESEPFFRNIYRFLRFRYPTYIFDSVNFEIDDNGTPYFICPVKDYKIGLFGGETVSRVILVNAVTGEHKNYKVQDVPNWVDRVYSAELLISYYDYYGSLKHGYLNTLFSQKDCLKTTEGYNYIALEDDVWVYTGVTSVSSDRSNVGFVLMNQRTAKTRYYSISGAEEFSAMNSAEGKVQNLGYKATFPLLLNIANEPTYFIALKDGAGLVKSYAMVNIEKYNNVAIGDTVNSCEKAYIAMLKTNGISITDTSALSTVTGNISKIAQNVIDGNSHYYIMLDNSSSIFDISVSDHLEIIKYNPGDTITFTYSEGEKVNLVLEIK